MKISITAYPSQHLEIVPRPPLIQHLSDNWSTSTFSSPHHSLDNHVEFWIRGPIALTSTCFRYFSTLSIALNQKTLYNIMIISTCYVIATAEYLMTLEQEMLWVIRIQEQWHQSCDRSATFAKPQLATPSPKLQTHLFSLLLATLRSFRLDRAEVDQVPGRRLTG